MGSFSFCVIFFQTQLLHSGSVLRNDLGRLSHVLSSIAVQVCVLFCFPELNRQYRVERAWLWASLPHMGQAPVDSDPAPLQFRSGRGDRAVGVDSEFPSGSVDSASLVSSKV